MTLIKLDTTRLLGFDRRAKVGAKIGKPKKVDAKIGKVKGILGAPIGTKVR
jgi:hypothetical protein